MLPDTEPMPRDGDNRVPIRLRQTFAVHRQPAVGEPTGNAGSGRLFGEQDRFAEQAIIAPQRKCALELIAIGAAVNAVDRASREWRYGDSTFGADHCWQRGKCCIAGRAEPNGIRGRVGNQSIITQVHPAEDAVGRVAKIDQPAQDCRAAIPHG